ncbi:MAG: bifunctional (p)ppGpp synthetase/guanosine-3',5'-bis(diphosphate) 3'-pyrophosphohydrolase [Prevotella sp.]|nr:bifunctional (p)ppGpp synthetase/guanosine-3',5'-bis(diphosphate) 3'-pyrophosphohydrolase [Prevotella sp.]MBR5037013.1 bifunctional (p)ppGpp synthetase/guanosine-3',5'-bis(diphosphate) 3'-pyrophosphohydrolase [Prevotella sp.]MBR5699360.1 bifunctional (p)ppGpp synthetase/guanosine-3',5'-bis(diphosphate) 3'-pyrophosphohydrolase [Prevotella sp.]
MERKLIFTQEETSEIRRLAGTLRQALGDSLQPGDEAALRRRIRTALENNEIERDVFNLNPVLSALQTAQVAVEETGLRRDGVLALILYKVQSGEVEEFGPGVSAILHGLLRITALNKKSPVVESENFRNLLLSFAEDMRVILIMIADRVNLMRQIRDTENEEAKHRVSDEAAYLYAPLAHKLGLYKLKSELEDLSLKYLEHDAYYMIREKLNATKESRDAYIDRFIEPVRQRLEDIGLKFHMKGRTKSIHSIWQKMKKQKCGFEGIYDLFAIRIIIDSPLEKEKMQCWQAFSIVTDMYQPNPKRLRDWLSVPKSNGYESLHITVLGPEQKWVEVQIRTERMDEIAERGLAAHWRYKGVKGETGLDEWLTNIRTALEAGDDLQVMDQFKLDLYDDEVFVFTPKGDLLKFPKGATILDLAYHIHSHVGSTCVGGKVNGKVVAIRQQLHSGDTVEILTQSTQKPRQEWLNIVKTSRARSKIRLALKETQQKDGRLAKEMLERKLKNKKIEYSESILAHTIKKLGFKEAGDFYKQLAEEKLDVNLVLEKYQEVRDYDLNLNTPAQTRSAEEYNFDIKDDQNQHSSDDELVIGSDLKGIDYSLAKCCRPIYGDDIFGFVTVSGGIKVHRTNCPNARHLRENMGYRVVRARWSGKGGSQYSITLNIIGNDDIGIVNNITSIISKEEKIMMRSINIDSHDGLFDGHLTVMVEDTSRMESLIKKLRTVKGVKSVSRL